MKRIFQFLLAVSLISTSACSENSQKDALTDDQIRELTTNLSKAYKKPITEAENIIKASYTDNATFVFASPGMPETTLTKKEYLANLKNYHAAAQDVSLAYKIDEIKISEDKKSAIVNDTATIEKDLPAQNQKDKKLTIKGLTKCERSIVLSNDNRPQIQSVKCTSQSQPIPSKK